MKRIFLMIDETLNAATAAFKVYRNTLPTNKAEFLRAIEDEINALGEELVNRVVESGSLAGRITGEIGRATSQPRMFADLIEEGAWVDTVVDTSQSECIPIPRPDIRRMMVPIGPVVVFGTSNFPLAFSVAGGDTASALTADCPVIVKAQIFL